MGPPLLGARAGASMPSPAWSRARTGGVRVAYAAVRDLAHGDRGLPGLLDRRLEPTMLIRALRWLRGGMTMAVTEPHPADHGLGAGGPGRRHGVAPVRARLGGVVCRAGRGRGWARRAPYRVPCRRPGGPAAYYNGATLLCPPAPGRV